MTTSTESKAAEKTWSQEFEVAGNQLLEKIQGLVSQGNARRVIIRKLSGEPLVDIPLTAGVAAGAVGLLIPGIRAVIIIGSLGAYLSHRFKVEVLHQADDVDANDDVQQIKVEVAEDGS